MLFLHCQYASRLWIRVSVSISGLALVPLPSLLFILYIIWSQHIVLTSSFGDVLVDKRNADRLNKEFIEDKEYKWSVRALSMTRIQIGCVNLGQPRADSNVALWLCWTQLMELVLYQRDLSLTSEATLHQSYVARPLSSVQTRERHRINSDTNDTNDHGTQMTQVTQATQARDFVSTFVPQKVIRHSLYDKCWIMVCLMV